MRRRGFTSRSVSMDTAIYRLTPGGEEFEIPVEVSGSANPYSPGNYDNPPEGGDVEDIVAMFYDEQAKKKRDFPLTDAEIKQFAEDLAEDYDGPDGYEEDYHNPVGDY